MSKLYQKQEFFSGTNCSMRVEKALKTKSAPADQQQLMSNTSQKSKNWRSIRHSNCRLTTRELADMVGISNGSVNTILKEVLCLRKVK